MQKYLLLAFLQAQRRSPGAGLPTDTTATETSETSESRVAGRRLNHMRGQKGQGIRGSSRGRGRATKRFMAGPVARRKVTRTGVCPLFPTMAAR